MMRLAMAAASVALLVGCSSMQGGGSMTRRENTCDETAAEKVAAMSNETQQQDEAEYSCVVPTLGERWQRVYEIGERFYEPILNCTGFIQQGIGSWYGIPFHGRQTSNGEIFDMNALSAAHKTLPLGIWIKVTNLVNGREVIVRVNDRGPYFKDRVLDLSVAAAKELGYYETGTAPISIQALGYARSERLTKRWLSPEQEEVLRLHKPPFNPVEVIYGSSPKAGEYAPDQVKPEYTVQVAAFKTLEKAEAVLIAVQTRFQSAVMKAYPMGDCQIYCIRLEKLTSRQQAENAKKSLAEIGFPKSMIMLERFEKLG
ncbi:MAG: septal ring lytic transglycosylase RlpA family protein [Pedobacter sp.]